MQREMTKLNKNRLDGSRDEKRAQKQKLHHEEQSKVITEAKSQHEQGALEPKNAYPEFSLFVEDWHHRSSEHSFETASNKVGLSTVQNLAKSDSQEVRSPSADRLRIPRVTEIIELNDQVSLELLSELDGPIRSHRDTERELVVALGSQDSIDMLLTSALHGATSAPPITTQKSAATNQDLQVPIVANAAPRGTAIVELESPVELDSLKELSPVLNFRRFEWRKKDRLNKKAKERNFEVAGEGK